MMRKSLLLAGIITLVGCGPKFSKSTFITESEDSYECVLLTPKNSQGYFVYLTDSNDFVTYPTALMKEMLRRDYTVVIPQRWGDNARSRGTLDTYENRMQGVSYALTEILGDSVFNTIFLAEGFYTPIAIRLAKDYRPDELWMIEPMGQSLGLTALNQHRRDADSAAFFTFWELDSLEEMYPFTNHLDGRLVAESAHRFFGRHYSRFIQGYWNLEDPMGYYSQLDDVKTKVVFHSDYVFHTPENRALFDPEKTMSIPLPQEMDTVNYSVQMLEMLFLED